jgi:RecB family endonuclease NucS
MAPDPKEARDFKAEVESALSQGRMVVAVGNCTVRYEGRAASKISAGDRLVVMKSDGTFLVHQSKGMAAINYQGPGASVRCEEPAGGKLLLVAERKKPVSERIEVAFESVQFLHSFPVRDDAQIKVMGTERELSNLLMADLSVIEPGLVPLQQESGLAKGMIDILAEDREGNIVVVELKRRTAGLAAASQLIRYVQELQKRKARKVRGILCSPEISPNAKSFVEKEGCEWRKLDYKVEGEARITGLEKKQKSLGEY